MELFSFAKVRNFFSVFTLVMVFGCATVQAPATAPSCDQMVKTVGAESQSDGFAYLEARADPAGQLAVFVSKTTARLFYLTPAQGVAEYLAANGWERRGECRQQDTTVFLLRREVPLQKPAGEQASL